jgi:hypothetical protein
MGLTDKAKELADTAFSYAGKAGERATELSGVAREKAPDYVDRAAELAGRAMGSATAGVDRATGGRFHDRLDGARLKVDEALDRTAPGAASTAGGTNVVPGDVVEGQDGEPITPAGTNPEAADPLPDDRKG